MAQREISVLFDERPTQGVNIGRAMKRQDENLCPAGLPKRLTWLVYTRMPLAKQVRLSGLLRLF